MQAIGFGDKEFTFAVYIANTPKMSEYQTLGSVVPLTLGEINAINQCCGNGWRKVFNVYAKLLYALNQQYYKFSTYAPTWQEYRDNYLLQENSKTALLFSAPDLIEKQCNGSGVVHIIMGKSYAKELINKRKVIGELIWLDDEFAIDINNNLIICPYFDYRQLSNIKIERLASLLFSLKGG